MGFFLCSFRLFFCLSRGFKVDDGMWDSPPYFSRNFQWFPPLVLLDVFEEMAVSVCRSFCMPKYIGRLELSQLTRGRSPVLDFERERVSLVGAIRQCFM